MNREDFEIFNDNDLIYFDNAATTMKPKCVVNSIVEYYTKYTANSHRGDYTNSLIVDEKYEGVREKVRTFINAEDSKEIIFTKGSTEGFNTIIFGFMSRYLNSNDEVLLTKGEHASNILPWITLSEKIGFKIRYISLNDDYSVSLENVIKAINEEVERIINEVRKFVEGSFSYEIYDVTFKKIGKQKVLEVFIDTPEGVTVDDCEKVSRGLSDYLDEVDLIAEAFTLEVSSPGIERVFKRQVDYERHIGKLVKWTLRKEGADGKIHKEVFEARLQEFSPDKIVVKNDKELREFPLSVVKEAQAVFEFSKEMSANKRKRCIMQWWNQNWNSCLNVCLRWQKWISVLRKES